MPCLGGVFGKQDPLWPYLQGGKLQDASTNLKKPGDGFTTLKFTINFREGMTIMQSKCMCIQWLRFLSIVMVFLVFAREGFSDPDGPFVRRAEKHFDKAVGKFVDETNRRVIGLPVDADIRDLQKAAVKYAIDPRSRKSDQYYKEMVSAIEKVVDTRTSSAQSSRGSSSYEKPDPCIHIYRKLAKLAEDRDTQKAYNPQLENDIGEYHISILRCYIDNKENNRALFWAVECEKSGVVQKLITQQYYSWQRERKKLDMVLSGQDNW